jgi:bifunctional DNase/RNase
MGLLEATAIAGEIEGVRFFRPMTHDLLKDFMDKTDMKLNYIEICDLMDNTCYALIHLTSTGKCIPNQYFNRIDQLADISYGKWSLILNLENKVKH